MTTGLHILTEGDDADTLAGGSNVISLFASPPHDDFKLIGDEFAWILDDLAVRMRGQFAYPRILVLTASGGD